MSSPEEVAVERREREVILESELEKEEHRLVNDVRGKEEQLAKAHQDVIAQMREAMLEARGGTKVGTGGERERWECASVSTSHLKTIVARSRERLKRSQYE